MVTSRGKSANLLAVNYAALLLSTSITVEDPVQISTTREYIFALTINLKSSESVDLPTDLMEYTLKLHQVYTNIDSVVSLLRKVS